MLFSRKRLSFTMFLLRLQKAGSRRQKVGVKYSKFGVNENSRVSITGQWTQTVNGKEWFICDKTLVNSNLNFLYFVMLVCSHF